MLTVPAPIYSNARPPPFGLPSCDGAPSRPLPSLFGLSASSPSPPPPVAPLPPLLSAVYTCDSRLFFFFCSPSSLPLPFRPGRLSFRPAREPLISADFARRADPWNPRGYLSPGGSFLSFCLSSPRPPSPSSPHLVFLQNSPQAAL